MIATIEILEGPHAGKTYELKPGDQIGRTQGNVLIEDSRISGLHAQVEIDQRNHLVLVDLNSSNGLQINGQRVQRVALLTGVHFLLGKTPARVSKVEEQGNLDEHLWRLELNNFCLNFEDLKFREISTLPAVQAFSPALKISFSGGAFFGNSWTLGFGPREVGRETRDLLIGDPDLPPVAFDLIPRPGGAELVVRSGFKIFVNQAEVKRHVLRNQDIISCGAHSMVVEFVK